MGNSQIFEQKKINYFGIMNILGKKSTMQSKTSEEVLEIGRVLIPEIRLPTGSSRL